jgi:1,4-dihydroxy-2-naphthoate octaprenyltransferase
MRPPRVSCRDDVTPSRHPADDESSRKTPVNATPARIRKYAAAARLFSLPLSLLPVAVAFAAADPPGLWHWDRLAANVLGVALLSAAGNLLNDYFDYVQRVDRKLAQDAGRPGRMLLRGEITKREVLGEAVACLCLAAAPAAYLTWRCGPAVVAFAAFAAAGLYAYTGPPFKLKYRALGEPLIFVLFGPALMAAVAFTQTGRVEVNVLLVAVPIGLATTAVLLGNNIRDAEEDRQAGIRTLAHVAGRRAGAVYVGLVLAAAALPCALAAAGLPPGLVLCPLSLLWVRRAAAAVWRGRRLADIDVRTARFSAALAAIILAALLAG